MTPPPDPLTIPGTDQSDRKAEPPLASGALDLCKQPDAGITAGQLFVFHLTLSGVTRGVTVGAGSCLQLEVPREGAPLGKGYFQATPADVTRLLPGSATLRVDAANLSSADVQAILAAAPNVTPSPSLLLNLAQQLITADLNVLRGVQASAQVLAAIADANAALQITAGADIVLTSSLPPAALSALVATLTEFNEGKTKPPAVPSSVNVDVVETIGSLVELTAIGCDPAAQCSGADLGTGRVTATIASGATTTVTFTNRSKPVLRACKVAGAGLAEGLVFRIAAGGIDVVASGQADVPTGECRDIVLPEGNFEVVEGGPIKGVAVSAIGCDPASRCSDASLGLGRVEVAIVRGITTVTFTNRSNLGTLRFCKVAGTGISAGTMFGMAAGGINLNPPAGEATSASVQVPAGECREATLFEGTYEAGEPNSGPGVTVSPLICEPAERCSNVSLGLGIAHVQVVGASTTTVNITNRSTLGTLRFCKVAGAGITAGREFHMAAAGINLNPKVGEPTTASVDVPAGECRDATLLEGSYEVAESDPIAGVRVSSITCEPADRCSSIGSSFLHAQIVGASTTVVTFTNRSSFGTLRVCKVAGTGVAAGTVFHFGAGGINLNPAIGEPTTASLDVPAGECREATLLEGNYEVAEGGPVPGVAVTAISCNVAERCTDVSLGLGALKARIVGASVTEVTFTNSASAAMSVPIREVWALTAPVGSRFTSLAMTDSLALPMHRWFDEVWNKGNAKAIAEMMAENAIIHGLAEAEGDVRGPAGFMPFFEKLRNAFPDIQVTIEDVIEEGDLMASRWTATMTPHGSSSPS